MMVRSVREGERTTMLTIVSVMVTTDEKRLGIELIICRRVSMSLV